MAWISKYRKAMIYGLVVSASGVVAVASANKLKNINEDEPNAVPQYPQKTPTFSSAFPLEKVLASWTTNFEPSVKWDSNWDRLDPKSLVKPEVLKANPDEISIKTPKTTRHLYLIRHGQYAVEEKDDKNRILSKLGREQANFTGLRLKDLNHPYSVIINSTLTRAIETSDIICESFQETPRKSNDMLCEGSPIPPEPPLGGWRPNAAFYKDGARIEAAFRNFFYRASYKQTEDSHEIIVCHANVIRYFVCRALQLPPEAWLRMSLAHGSITWIAIRPNGNVTVRCVGDMGHIPPDKISFH